MAEIRTGVNVIEVDMVCDYCGDGRMRPIGTTLKDQKPLIIHMCDCCGEKGIYSVRYPYIERN